MSTIRHAAKPTVPPELAAHPHALAILGPPIELGEAASHAYLFHGPPGALMGEVARALATSLLTVPDRSDPSTIASRVARDTHPDLTWVTPSGAGTMLVSDIDEAVVSAASRTPFESTSRVFVIEGVEAMNDQAANRLLKTLEEPPSYVHLILLTSRLSDVAPTIVSRCQLVRFDPPSPSTIEDHLRSTSESADPLLVAAASRLCLGDLDRARYLTTPDGIALREASERFIRSVLSRSSDLRGWVDLLRIATASGTEAGKALTEKMSADLELIPTKERRRHERETSDSVRRIDRRERGRALDLALSLCELYLRDLWSTLNGAPDLVHGRDREANIREDASMIRSPSSIADGIDEICDTRLTLSLNVSEELGLEALSYRLEDLLGRSENLLGRSENLLGRSEG